MLWTWMVFAACAVIATPTEGFDVLFPGPTDCTAPSGRPGDCVTREDCLETRRPMSKSPCGYSPKNNNALLYCCERRAPIKTAPRPTPVPSPAPSPNFTAANLSRILPTDCGRALGANAEEGLGSVPVRNIAFGETAQRNSWPWAALIGFELPGRSFAWQCGGVLISSRHVLTAAHCVPQNGTITVRLGEHDPAEETNKQRQDRTVLRAVRHPDFRGSQNDLALLTLDSPVHLNRSVQPICLPKPDKSLVGRRGFVVGWGKLAFDAPDDVVPPLQEALVQITDSASCEALYRRTRDFSHRFPDGFRGRVLCASDPTPNEVVGGLAAADACKGDSGGPLSVELRDGRYVLAGLVLEGLGCGNPDFPGLYTRIASYNDWIHSELVRSESQA